MSSEILKAIFPLLDGFDLVSCMLVCKQWRDIAQDDYVWKCVCAKRWPSLCRRPLPANVTYYKLFRIFNKRQRSRALPPPRLSFDDLNFYIDIWLEGQLIFSEVVSGPALIGKMKNLPTGISRMLKPHLERPDFKMIFPVEPCFSVPLGQTAIVTVLVERKDVSKFATIINKAFFEYVEWTFYRANAFDYLDFSPNHPFIMGIRAWLSLLLTNDDSDEAATIFGIEMDFRDAATNEKEVLWLLEMLDWK